MSLNLKRCWSGLSTLANQQRLKKAPCTNFFLSYGLETVSVPDCRLLSSFPMKSLSFKGMGINTFNPMYTDVQYKADTFKSRIHNLITHKVLLSLTFGNKVYFQRASRTSFSSNIIIENKIRKFTLDEILE